MGEIYVAAFERDGDSPVATGDEIVIAPASYELPQGEADRRRHRFRCRGWRIAVALRGSIRSHRRHRVAARGDVARLGAIAFERGEALAPERVEPAYLRNNVALTLVEQRARKG